MSKKTFYGAVLLPILCLMYAAAAMVADPGITAEKADRASNPIKTMYVGEPIVGGGQGARVRLGAAYMRGSHKTARKAAPAAVKAAAPLSISSDFVIGEVYVYPNPAKGGKVPAFHIEVGVADSVKLTIYTVAAHVVHERTLTGMPQTFTKGTKSVYAYEYPWGGHIASGVYYYSIKAEKAGKTLKKTGKFAVIR